MKPRSFLVSLFFLVLSFVIMSVYAAELMLYLSFDEGSGKTIHDKSGENNKVNVNGKTSWVNGHYEGALEFDGVADCLEIEHSDSLDITEGITLEAWVNFAKPPTWEGIIAKENAYRLLVDTEWGSPEFNIYTGGNKGEIHGGEKASVSDKTWHHIAGTYDGDQDLLYVDGVVQKSQMRWQNPPQGTITSNQNPVFIGSLGADHFYAGQIDEVKIWNAALIEEEIKLSMAGKDFAIQPRSKITTIWGKIKLSQSTDVEVFESP